MAEVAILNIGNELLKGRTVNTNAAMMAGILREAGLAVGEVRVVADAGDPIREAIRGLLAAWPVILVTGGLGPTKDDITKVVLQEFFGGEMVTHAPTRTQIEALSARLGRPMNPLNAMQAQVPSSCEVLPNRLGTAPGMCFRRDGRILIAMPGVPFETEALMREQVLPLLRQAVGGGEWHSRVLRLWGIAESSLALKMEPLEPDYPAGLQVSYLPALDGISLELGLHSAAGDAGAAAEMDALVGRIQSHLQDYVIATEGGKMELLLGKLLLARGIQFATAESATAGMIASKLAGLPGISAVLRGGVVAYSAEVKTQVLGVPAELIAEHGVVSEAVACAMARGARTVLGADVAVSVTGYAEAWGDGPEQGPRAWIGYSDARQTFATEILLMHSRNVNRERMAYAALVQAWRVLKTYTTSAGISV